MSEMIILGVFSTAVVWLPNVLALIAFRFIIGIGFGGFYNGAFVYSKIISLIADLSTDIFC